MVRVSSEVFATLLVTGLTVALNTNDQVCADIGYGTFQDPLRRSAAAV